MSIARQANPEQIAFARRLRREQTKAERLLWSRLRRGALHGKHFRRQQPLGLYTLDFYCHEARLAIELDGSQHAERIQALRDAARDAFCRARGITVLRFFNDQVLLELERVLAEIERHVDARAAPSPLPPGGLGRGLSQPSAPRAPSLTLPRRGRGRRPP